MYLEIYLIIDFQSPHGVGQRKNGLWHEQTRRTVLRHQWHRQGQMGRQKGEKLSRKGENSRHRERGTSRRRIRQLRVLCRRDIRTIMSTPQSSPMGKAKLFNSFSSQFNLYNNAVCKLSNTVYIQSIENENILIRSVPNILIRIRSY